MWKKTFKIVFLLFSCFLINGKNVMAKDKIMDGWCPYISSNGEMITVVINEQIFTNKFGFAEIYLGKYSEGNKLNNIQINFENIGENGFSASGYTLNCAKKVYIYEINGEKYIYDYIPGFIVDSNSSYTEYDVDASNIVHFKPIQDIKCVYKGCKSRTYEGSTITSETDNDSTITLDITPDGKYSGTFNGKKIDVSTSHNSQFDIERILRDGKCPKYALYETHYFNNVWFGDDESKLINDSKASTSSKAKDSVYCTYDAEKSIIEDREADREKREESANQNNSNGSISNINLGTSMNCNSLKATKTYEIIKQIFKWLQIAAPIMLVIFGVMDFGKAVASGDNDAIKKAQKTFVKRVIIVAIIMILPLIIELLFSLLDGALGNDISTCEIGR